MMGWSITHFASELSAAFLTSRFEFKSQHFESEQEVDFESFKSSTTFACRFYGSGSKLKPDGWFMNVIGQSLFAFSNSSLL